MPLFKNKFKAESNRLKDWDYSSEGIYFITMVTENRECIFGNIENCKMILNHNGLIIKNELLKSIQIRDSWIFHHWVIMPNHIHLLVEITVPQSDYIHLVETHPVETHRSASHESKSNIQKHRSVFHESKSNAETHRSASHESKSNAETHRSASHESKSNNHETHSGASLPDTLQDDLPKKLIRKSNSISSFVAIFKSVTTKQIVELGNDGDYKDALRCNDDYKDALRCVSTKKIWQSNYHDHIVRNFDSFEMIHQYISNNPRNWDNDSINSK
jgi:putative transposase